MTFFRILWGFNALIALVVLFFFFWGIADGTVSSFNIGIWLILLGLVAGVLLGSRWLRAQNRTGLANGLLCILAIPGLLYLLFLLVLIVSEPRWN